MTASDCIGSLVVQNSRVVFHEENSAVSRCRWSTVVQVQISFLGSIFDGRGLRIVQAPLDPSGTWRQLEA